MNDLLLKSLKISYETSEQDLPTLAQSVGMSEEELVEYSNSTSLPISSWQKQEVYNSSSDNNSMNENNSSDKEVDLVRKNLDTLTNDILEAAKQSLVLLHDPTPKELKDLVSIVATIEAYKYPKKQTSALHVDMQKGIVNFLSTVEDDI